MPRMTRDRQQRIVPERSVDAYIAAGWTLAGGSRPADDDRKAVWIEHAIAQGYDPDEGLTKAELIERYG